MIIPTYTPYARVFADQYGKEHKLIFIANNHGTVVHWESSVGVEPVAKVTSKGKVALLQKPKLPFGSAPFHLYHAILRVQTLGFMLGDEECSIFDTRHSVAIVPQTLHEAQSALDKIIPGVVAELDFIAMSGPERFHTAREEVLNAMHSVCKDRYVPRRTFKLDAPVKEGPVTAVEQTIIEHIVNGLYTAEGESLESDNYARLIDYIRQKIEIVLNEMNGALGE